LRQDENAGAIPSQQARSRGGGQPEPSGGEVRGEAESCWGHKKLFEIIFWVPRARQLLALRQDENAGAIPSQQARSRGGGQPEPSGGEVRGEAESCWGHR